MYKKDRLSHHEPYNRKAKVTKSLIKRKMYPKKKVIHGTAIVRNMEKAAIGLK